MNHLNEPNQSTETEQGESTSLAELELQWQDAHAQRQRAEELFHSDELDYSSEDDLGD